jgi:hypothetical protein
MQRKYKIGDKVIVIKLVRYSDGSYIRYLFKVGKVTSTENWKIENYTVKFRATTGTFQEEELMLVTKTTNIKAIKLLYGNK